MPGTGTYTAAAAAAAAAAAGERTAVDPREKSERGEGAKGKASDDDMRRAPAHVVEGERQWEKAWAFAFFIVSLLSFSFVI